MNPKIFLREAAELFLSDSEQSAILYTFPSVAVDRFKAVQKVIKINMRVALKPGFSDLALKFLYEAGAGFDVASVGEVKQLLRALKLNSLENLDICWTKPIYWDELLDWLMTVGIRELTVEYTTDLKVFAEKHKKWFNISLRMGAVEQEEGIHLANKFGLRWVKTSEIFFSTRWLQEVEEAEILLKGIHFHPGSDMKNAKMHSLNFKMISNVIQVLLDMNLLDVKSPVVIDIGGGPNYCLDLKEWALCTQNAFNDLEKTYNLLDFRLCAQFGAYFAGPSLLVSSVIGVGKNGIDTGTVELKTGCYHGVRDAHQQGVVKNFFPNMAFARLTKKELSFIKINGSKQEIEGFSEISIFGASCDSTDYLGNLYMPKYHWNNLYKQVRTPSNKILMFVPETRAYGGESSTCDFMGIPKSLEITIENVDSVLYSKLLHLCRIHAIEK